MRTIKPMEAEVSASFDLTIIQNIPAPQLEALETTYSFMLNAVRDALKARRKHEDWDKDIHLRLVKSKEAWNHDCLVIRRIRRRGISFRSLARITGNIHDAREMAKHGNALARSRQADEKKALIIELHRQGIGPCPAARMVAGRFGRCSAPYVVKIIRGYRNALQPSLPMSAIRAIR